MEITRERIGTWSLPLTEAERGRIGRHIRETVNDSKFIDFVNPYLKRLKPYIGTLLDSETEFMSHELLSSGIFCFYGGILFALCQNKLNSDTINDLFHFALLYMMTDHYLDDVKHDKAEKERITGLMKQLLESETSGDGKFPEVENHYLKQLLTIFRRLIKRHPKSIKWMRNVFYAEAQGMIVQRNPEMSREAYLYAAEEKGGATTQAIQSLLDPDSLTEIAHQLGVCIQLIDDMLDVDNDIESDIHTVATYDFRKDHNLDTLFHYTVAKVYNLDPQWNAFKPFLMLMLTYLTSKPGKFSEPLTAAIRTLCWFTSSDVNVGEMMNSWLMRHL